MTAILDPHYPSFNLGIPDQYRMDYYLPILAQQDAAGQVPNLTIMWLPDDHTNGTTTGDPLPANYEADNDLALGRLVEAISNTKTWGSTAIFVEEDDSQDGVDHVDGHRQPVYLISPYTVAPQSKNIGKVINTTYTQENINRTIENILGLHPLTQFDLVAAPMFDCFQNTPDNTPFTHVPATTPLNIGPGNVVIPGTGAQPLYVMQMPHKMSPIEKGLELRLEPDDEGQGGQSGFRGRGFPQPCDLVFGDQLRSPLSWRNQGDAARAVHQSRSPQAASRRQRWRRRLEPRQSAPTRRPDTLVSGLRLIRRQTGWPKPNARSAWVALPTRSRHCSKP